MTRLIDADKFLSSMIKRFKCVPLIGRNDYDCESLKQMLIEAPTVDAVEVVRCKDCTQWGGVTFGNVCKRWSAPLAGMKNCTGAEDFCSYGERRTDGV